MDRRSILQEQVDDDMFWCQEREQLLYVDIFPAARI